MTRPGAGRRPPRARRTCFWFSAAGAGWVLVGYPLALALRPRRPWRREPHTPTVSILVPAYNEFEALPHKLRALAELDYPEPLVQVVVSIDGDPGLVPLAQAARPDAEVLCLPERSGKAAALTAGLERATGEILVLTDANNVLAPGSLRSAVSHFADPAVWAVAGQRLETDSAYDRYEDLVRRLESRSGSVAAISGDFIAVRRAHMPALGRGVVNEDLWLLLELVRAGGRVVYDPDVSTSEPGLDVAGELARRSRIAAGRALLAGELGGLPAGFLARLLSHKAGRLALPFLLATALASSLSLARRRLYARLCAAQLGVYALGALAAGGLELPGPGRSLSRAARQLLVGNVAVAAGVIRAARGRQDPRWSSVRK